MVLYDTLGTGENALLCFMKEKYCVCVGGGGGRPQYMVGFGSNPYPSVSEAEAVFYLLRAYIGHPGTHRCPG